MPFDANGNFSLVPGTIVSDGMTIQPSQHNPPFQDVAAGLGQVVLRSGVAPMTGNLNMNGQKVTGLATATVSGDALPFGQATDAIYAVGDYKDTVNNLGSKWLRRDGSVYDISAYPVLAPLMSAVPAGLTWTLKSSSPLSVGLYGIANSGTTIVAVGQSTGGGTGSARLSTDGNTWTARVISGAYPMFDVAYGNGLFVAVGASGATNNSQAAVSANNGSSWSLTVVASVLFRRVMFANGLFWASGTQSASPYLGAIYSSPDGVTWTKKTIPTAVGDLDVAYGNGIYIAIKIPNFGSTGARVLTSPDGSTWTDLPVAYGGRSIRFYDGKFMIGVGVITEDGVNFDSYPPGSLAGYISDVAFVAGKGWVGAGNGTSVSSNLAGTSWAEYSVASANVMQAIIPHPFTANKVIAVGNGGVIMEGTFGDGEQFSVPDDKPIVGWIKAR